MKPRSSGVAEVQEFSRNQQAAAYQLEKRALQI
jgi:hypothetical protein